MEREQRERHTRWLDSLSDRDWSCIHQAAATLGPDKFGAAVTDLDAKGIRIGLCPVDHARYFSGERIETVKEGSVAVLVWELTESERRR